LQEIKGHWIDFLQFAPFALARCRALFAYENVGAAWLFRSDQLSEAEKVKLCAAEGPDGWSGLIAARQNGHQETVTAYQSAILNSNLSAEAKKRLSKN
jgi:hypothetical protein